MDTSVTPATLASLEGLSIEQIAALDTTDEVLARLVPESTPVPVAAFNSGDPCQFADKRDHFAH